MPPQHPPPRWYLILCKPRQDSRAEENLTRQAFKCYRPIQLIERIQRGRRTTSVRSLFPGYLFIQLDQLNDNWHPIRSTRGVNQLVTFGKQPIAVADELIEQLRKRLQNHLTALPKNSTALEPGDHVRITSGSYKELEAIFLAHDGAERIVILLQLLHREHTLSVPITAIEKT
ncbi:transcription/translation regulatory transformer protein RfaH [Pseudomonas gregormendelii]|uniref:Transcription antitermination protein RfaH n=1 Tax=Pseudomonas gregormendelii TaxID=1628277 RepID=A0ABS3AIP0_9PSED|nr:transcription/translation regulatory transformer protein RfaH [Pseudomonas gregormendelii]MBN3966965.1 transcription/translation regulatory transformer protein RfaH [Pseudomonas gregormendelii]